MEHGRRLKMTLYLEPDLARAVDQDARKRHLPTTRAAADAIRRALVDERAEGLADTVKMRLDRLEKREVIRAREMAIIKEAILLYVRVWLEHTPPPEEEFSDAISLAADQRFSEFLDLLAESLEPGRNLFDESPHGHSHDIFERGQTGAPAADLKSSNQGDGAGEQA